MLPVTSDIASRPSPDANAIRCVACPCGCVCLRWHGTLLLHFDDAQLTWALNCLEDILQEPSRSFSLGEEAFCACRAADGHYYLACQERVVLRLSEDDARCLRAELAFARDRMTSVQPAHGGHLM